MKQIKALFKNKKIIISVIAVLLVATVATTFALNQPNQNAAPKQEAMSDEDHAKLVANLKASREEAEQAKIQAEKKAEEEKKVAEEKAKEEQAKKEKEETEKKAEAEKQKEQQIKRSQSGNTTPVQPKPSATPSNTAPKQNQTQPAPTPIQEEPKQEDIPYWKKPGFKYCEYNGPRKPVQNICNYGDWEATSPTGWNPNSFAVKSQVNNVNSGRIDLIVFHGETDRYHLITTPDLREGLENTKGSSCYINGSCVGFRVPGR